ncbi:MAG: RNA 2'-phosphotransferase [bacterium]|nr:RNA 2'-phosphotransferase [bacterium]
MPDRRRISKLLSLILRHRPDEFGLNMDAYGFIPLAEVVESVQQRYSAVEEEDIRDLIETSRQHRFEIVDDRVRALYGHSFFVEMDGEPMAAPEHLYLCVPAAQGQRMKEEGIRSEDRFYLHLSPTREVAESRAGTVTTPCIVEVRAAAAATEAEVQFWSRGEVVLTRQVIGAEYVGEVVEIEAPPGSLVRDDEPDERPRRRPGGGRERSEDGPRGRKPREHSASDSPPETPRPPRTAPPAEEPKKAPSFGRAPKFSTGSGRR